MARSPNPELSSQGTPTCRTCLLAVLLFCVLAVSLSAPPKGPTQAELSGAAAIAADWLHPNHDYGGQRFVDLAEINRTNVQRGLLLTRDRQLTRMSGIIDDDADGILGSNAGCGLSGGNVGAGPTPSVSEALADKRGSRSSTQPPPHSQCVQPCLV